MVVEAVAFDPAERLMICETHLARRSLTFAVLQPSLKLLLSQTAQAPCS